MSTIAGFWAWFKANEAALRRIDDSEHPMLDEAYRKLLEVSDGLAIEIGGGDDGVSEAIIGAGGNKTLFNLVDRIVREAPDLPAWKVVALKPALGFEFKSTYEGRVYNPAEMRFEFLRPPSPGRGGHLKVYVPGLPGSEAKNAEFIVWKILDTALGERSCALDVEAVEVEPMPRTPAAGAKPLPELPRHLLRRG